MVFKKGNIYGRLNKGKSTWNKDLTKEIDDRVLKMSNSLKGRISSRKNAILSSSTKKKISLNLKEQYKKGLLKGAFQKGSKIRNSGRTRFKKGQNTGINNINWKGGKSFEEYPKCWLEIREKIRKRDKYICQFCRIEQRYLKHKLIVHHIDENKQNCKINNLISVCRQCHTRIHRRKK